MPRVVNPKWFHCESGLIHWGEIWQLHVRHHIRLNFTGFFDDADTVADGQIELGLEGWNASVTEQGILLNGAHLRWATHPGMGIPSRAFRVWRRRGIPFEGEETLDPESLTTWTENGLRVISFGRPLALVRLQFGAGTTGAVIGFSGAPSGDRFVAMRQIATPVTVIAGPRMTGIMLPQNADLQIIQGVSEDDAANDPGWEEVERVGLPVDTNAWAGIGGHTAGQGLLPEGDPQNTLGSGLATPFDAALARYARGRAAIGWPQFVAPFSPAPPFTQPDGALLVEEMREQILGQIRDRMDLPPMQMHQALEQVTMPPPENFTGQVAPTEPSEATYSPLGLMLLGVTSDPNLSLILGYGTALPFYRPLGVFGTETDYMVTAEWDEGVTGAGPALEMAALALDPQRAFAGATPLNMEAVQSNPMSPVAPDAPWRRSVRVSWDRVPKTGLYRVASFAAMRRPLQPWGDAELMNEARPSGGFRPIAANAVAGDPDTGRVSAADRVVEIPVAVAPANNGFIEMAYAATTQTIFGLWGVWNWVSEIVREPNPARVPILAARLETQPPAVPGGLCPATLIVEFTWDWSVRTPETILISGRLWAAAKRSDPPPSEVPVMVLPRALGGGEPGLQITFAGDVPSVAGASIVGLTGDGESFADFGPAQGEDIRRYRVTVENFALDFDIEPHIGMHLFARVFERLAPGRVGPFPERPFAFAVSDPRPPVITLTPVDIGSLPDARSESHARLDWPSVSNARGYFIYEATESDMRAELGLDPSRPGQTLTERRAEVIDAYNLNPTRRPFTRRSAELERGTSTDVTLPKGSGDIHFFAILAQSQSGLDSAWPVDGTPGDQLFAIAAPRIAKPQPPVLELRRVPAPGDSFATQITVTPRMGHRARRVRIFRTRLADAARRVDTMGPPVAVLDASGAVGWDVQTASDAVATDFIEAVSGIDVPTGSWHRQWYRAEVWSGEDAARALLPGRSDPSPPQFVVIPPAGDPDLSPIDIDWPGGAPGDVLLRWSSAAPVPDTVLGAHNMSIDVRGAAGAAEAVLSEDRALSRMATAEAPPPDAAVWWREGDPDAAGIQQYRALLRRGPSRPRMSVSVRLRDPLGRISEQLVTVPGGSVLPEPVITDFTARPVARDIWSATWMMNAPLEPGPAGPWRIEVTAVLASSGGGGGEVLRARNFAVRRGGNFARFRGPLVAPGGRRRVGGFVAAPRRLRAQADVPEIEQRRRPPTRVAPDTLVIWRQTLAGRTLGFGVASGSRIATLTIRLIAPDGQSRSETLEFS